jgi:uncharacterized FlaG/YvyC family protein
MDEIRSVQSGTKDMPVSARTVGDAPTSAQTRNEPDTATLGSAIEMSLADAKKISRSLENALNASSKEVQFDVSAEEKAGNRINFRVVDRSTGEIVREFPSEEVRRIAEKALANMQQGLLFDFSI